MERAMRWWCGKLSSPQQVLTSHSKELEILKNKIKIFLQLIYTIYTPPKKKIVTRLLGYKYLLSCLDLFTN